MQAPASAGMSAEAADDWFAVETGETEQTNHLRATHGLSLTPKDSGIGAKGPRAGYRDTPARR